MPKIDLGPYITSVAVALVFFALGRFLVIQLEDVGRWVIFVGLFVFYAIWWISYQRKKRKK